MGHQSPQFSKEISGTAPKDGGIDAPDKGLEDLKRGLARDAGQFTGGLKDLASDVADDAKQAVVGQLDSQKGRVVDGLDGVAMALRRVSSSGSESEGTAIAPALVPYLEGAAEHAERASHYFESKNLGEVARDVEAFARREPALFLGGAFALGLLGGRFLRASQPASATYGAGGQSRGRSGAQQGREPQQQGGSDRPMAFQAGNPDANLYGHRQGSNAINPPRQGDSFGAPGSSGAGGMSPSGSAGQSNFASSDARDTAAGRTPTGSYPGMARAGTEDKSQSFAAAPGILEEKSRFSAPTTGSHAGRNAAGDGKSGARRPVGP